MSRKLDNMVFTENFRLHEFLVSSDHPELAEKLDPSFYHVNNLHLLCATILQPARSVFGVTINVESGYRSPELNVAVGGATDPPSLHPYGKAADIYPGVQKYIGQIYAFIKDNLPFSFSQLIWYRGKGIIHVALPHPGRSRLCEVR